MPRRRKVALSKRNIWVVIPAYNEQKYIKRVLEKLKKYTSKIIVVDDGSRDKTVKIAQKYTPHTLVHLVNLGKGAALKTGCEYAFGQLGAEAVIFMDSDDQHDPKEIPHFIEALKKKHQIILGIRQLDREMPLLRRVGNKYVSLLVYFFFGKYIPDILSGYKAFTKKAYKKVLWQSNSYSVEMEISAKIARYKLAYITLPIKTIYHDTERGMTALDAIQMVTSIISWRLSL